MAGRRDADFTPTNKSAPNSYISFHSIPFPAIFWKVKPRIPFLTLVFCCWTVLLSAQLGDWSHRMPLQLRNENPSALGGYPVLLHIDTQTPIAAGQMAPDGRDIRFGDSCGGSQRPYWIESGINTDSTRIWVRIAGLPGSDSSLLYLFHGNPQVASAASFSAVFPLAFISQGSQTLSGPLVHDWFELQAGDTIYAGPGAPLTIFARNVRIDGVLMGDGSGHVAPPLGQPGNGPGAGGWSPNAGAGGAGYAGTGGTGGYDLGDTPGAGGPAYGTAFGPDIDMGSSGGSSSSRQGGAGGGEFAVYAESIRLSGKVLCDGDDAQQPGSQQGAGGGAGGGILLKGKYLVLSGQLSVRGGAGSVGLQSGNDDGGGGAGGRIKLFWEQSRTHTGPALLNGGQGGPSGSQASGQDGAPGVLGDSLQPFPTVAVTALPSAPTTLPPSPNLVPDPNPICPGEPVSFSLPLGYSNYAFSVNGTLLQDSSLSVFNAGVLPDGSTVNVTTTYGACVVKDTFVIQSAVVPPLHISASDSSACLGDTVILNAGPGWSSVLWSNGDTGRLALVSFSGFFNALATDTNGCPVRDTFVVNLGPPPIPSINVNGLPTCEGEPVTLTTGMFSGYAWSNGGTSQSTVVVASGSYSLTVTGTNGCEGSSSILIEMDTLPSPTIMKAGDTLICENGYASYQWFWNGSPLTSATIYYHIPAFNGIYSVEVADANGCTGISDTTLALVGIEGGMLVRDFSLYPNPAGEFLILEGHALQEGELVCQIWDAQGRLAQRESREFEAGDFVWKMETGALRPGMYLLEIHGKEADGRKKVLIFLKK